MTTEHRSLGVLIRTGVPGDTFTEDASRISAERAVVGGNLVSGRQITTYIFVARVDDTAARLGHVRTSYIGRNEYWQPRPEHYFKTTFAVRRSRVEGGMISTTYGDVMQHGMGNELYVGPSGAVKRYNGLKLAVHHAEALTLPALQDGLAAATAVAAVPGEE